MLEFVSQTGIGLLANALNDSINNLIRNIDSGKNNSLVINNANDAISALLDLQTVILEYKSFAIQCREVLDAIEKASRIAYLISERKSIIIRENAPPIEAIFTLFICLPH